MSRFAFDIVVVGGGVAGVTCIQTLQTLSSSSSICLVSPTRILKGATRIVRVSKCIEEFDVEEIDPDVAFVSETGNSISTMIDRVKRIDFQQKECHLVSGKTISYGQLALCTGAIPKTLNPNHPHVLTIRDAKSVEELTNRLVGARRVVVVGNGGIGLELVFALSRTCQVVWSVKDAHIGSPFMDEQASAFLLSTAEFLLASKSINLDAKNNTSKNQVSCSRELEVPTSLHGSALGPAWNVFLQSRVFSKESEYPGTSAGIRFEFSSVVESIQDNVANFSRESDLKEYYPVTVHLSSGNAYDCDFVVSATGVVPFTDYLDDEEIAHGNDGGLLVNENMQIGRWKKESSSGEMLFEPETSVYAAGDCASISFPSSNLWFQMRLWSQARIQGRYTAYSMCDQLEALEISMSFEMFTHVTQFFGFKVILLGRYNCQGLSNEETRVLSRHVIGNHFVKAVLHRGRLVGAILIGDTDMEDSFENLMLSGNDLSSFGDDLLHPEFEIEEYFD